MSGKQQIRKKRKRLLLLMALLLLLLLCVEVLIADGRTLAIRMQGGRELIQEPGTTYVEPGAELVRTGRLFGTTPLEAEVQAEGSVDTSTPGSYTITYTAEYHRHVVTGKRTVIVPDREAPVITLQHTPGTGASWYNGVVEEAYTAADNVDGDLTDRVQIERREERILYTVTDSAGNVGRAELSIATLQPPEICLTGGNTVELPTRFTFADPGYTALDPDGYDRTELVQVQGSVTPDRPGTYTLTYSITNPAGKRVQQQRQVTVVQGGEVQQVYPAQKTIYLTFDDGPGPYTAQLLDVLQQYGVKATFFVTGCYPKYEDLIGRAYREGHSIGVHTQSHDYKTVYASRDAFLQDFLAMEDIIFRQTGSYTDLLRFPGGSSNTVSRDTKGIMTRLTREFSTMGYSYFDWNVDSGDAAGALTRSAVVQNVTEGIAAKNGCCIVLQHDIKDYSVAAVAEIIEWGLANGYAFAALQADSPSFHHGVAN